MKELINITNICGVDCYEQNGTAFLKLEHVAWGLGLTQSKNGTAYVRWDRVEKYLAEIGFPHKWGKKDFIPENIFYRLAMKAKNPVAEAFQAKVADDIIPSIRKTGGYISGQETMSDIELLSKAVLVAQKQIEERNQKIQELSVKAIFADAVSASNTSILIGDLAKLICQNGVKIGQKRLFEWLRENGYLIKQKGASWNMPTQRSVEMGLFEVKETTITHADGHISINKTVKATGKAQVYFVNKFLNEKESESSAEAV